MNKILIISKYDGGWCFTYSVLENGIENDRGREERDLEKFGLYDKEWNWFDEKYINKDNKEIQQFDLIIFCDDGGIEYYKKGKNY